jgi:mRNA interferase MazF
MPKACAINLDHVQTVSKDKLGSVVTVLSVSRMAEVRSALPTTRG